MDNPGVGLGAVRDALAAPHGLPSVRESHPSTWLWECRVVQRSKIGRSMSAGGLGCAKTIFDGSIAQL
jgi:hypothetical protein